MKRLWIRHSLHALLAIAGLQLLGRANAEINLTGDFTPDPPRADEEFRLFSGTLDVDGGSALETGSAFVGNRAGELGEATVEGGGSRWDVNGIFWVGAQGQGEVSILNGGTIAYDAVGRVSRDGGDSIITLNGNDSSLIGGRYLVVGDLTPGTLSAQAGGQLQTGGANIGQKPAVNGIATLSGGNTLWASTSYLAAGYRGQGTLNIQAGAEMTNRHGVIGFASGAVGTVNVDGSGSAWTNTGRIDVGLDGAGTINVTRGGEVSTIDKMKVNGLSSVNVEDAGSQLNVTGSVSSRGALEVRQGGTAASAGLVLAEQPETFASLLIEGADSSWTSDSYLEVGFAGSATVTIIDGGFLSNTYAVLGRNQGGGGTLLVLGEDSRWESSREVEVGRRGAANIRIADGARADIGSTLTLGRGSEVRVTGQGSELAVGSRTNNGGALIVEPGATAFLTGGISNAGITGGGDTILSGLVEPGVDAGIMEFEANVSFNNDTIFVFDVGGLNVGGGYDQIQLTGGSMALDGFLNVVLFDDFALEVGQEFTILDVADAATLFGTFADLSEGDQVDAIGGGSLSISYLGGDGNDVVLTVVAAGGGGGGASGVNAHAVPEPATLSLGLASIAALVVGAGAGRRGRA